MGCAHQDSRAGKFWGFCLFFQIVNWDTLPLWSTVNNCVISRNFALQTIPNLWVSHGKTVEGWGRGWKCRAGRKINMGECYWKTESCVYNKTSTTCSQHLLGNLHALVCSHQIRRMLWYFCSGWAAIWTVYLHFLNLFPREQISTSQVIIQSLKGSCCHLRDKIVLLKRNFAGLKHSFSCSSLSRKQWAFCKRAFFTTISSGVCCAGSAPLHWAVLLTHRVPGQGESQLPAQEKAERGGELRARCHPLRKLWEGGCCQKENLQGWA